ncbi:NAD(P)/FAD-dependent oxidoreductase [Paraburkholderia sp. ZP32-5]|uniref:NAD(P)/FAD-dependent oxidoreductase n=1 Tax=Paraburkholderia sp. ZP32-5 TaxID=2883245 RepID=UPI001F1D87DF|nr:FAD-dependent oxidoreductase [Paraburkholderia sp. ZP32-5]
MTKRVLIIGAGHAAAQICGSLVEARQGGFAADITIVGAETAIPYHRPPLSKAFLQTPDARISSIRPAAFYTDHAIALHLGDAATSLDRQARRVTLASGRTLDYDELILATGSRPRRLAGVSADAKGVYYLRDANNAEALRTHLSEARRLVVIGGGFIGLEVAATANALAKQVVVLEYAPHLLMRALSPEMAGFLLRQHRANGIDIRLGARVEQIESDADGNVTAVRESDGTVHEADMVLIGIGGEPETTLAEQAGLACDNGIVVDACMRTSDPHILAVGDCTSFPLAGTERRVRLEAVQNASDQARCAVATLIGKPQPYDATPWFWSEQGGLRIQIAGLIHPEAQRFVRGDETSGKWSLLHYVNDELIAVETVNVPIDHLAARQLVNRGLELLPEKLCDASVPLKSWIPAAGPAN